MSVPTSEPQSMGTNRPRGLASWMARATTSLPVPLSPSSSTGSRLRDALPISLRIEAICGDTPTRGWVSIVGAGFMKASLLRI